MNPTKADRTNLKTFTDLPNVGKAAADDLRLLGYEKPEEITGSDPVIMYEMLCAITGVRQDPCVMDVFWSVTDFLGGQPAQSWWNYTERRKDHLKKMMSMR
ncbi:helix-hairpin-helix domain-containing protein [Morganella psychrotolerans]|uniref:Mitomycin resistance protein n=1 Tax=Morganella psychrotolerans TaxID=368603 RepID=A0A5M9R9C6_9GAMM|nr:helix-hairpin-helix domain-containing protein [Morganella psychrotolerans]KAA8716867.1 mitomycin resistance protein [Morganella psychrotolerans]OBU08791.1 mitomycin resistance protein [Morganella psychrotolerans]